MQSKRAPQSQTPEVSNEVEMMMKKMLRDLCSISQAAEILGVDESQARRLARSKRIAARKIDSSWIVYKPSLKLYPQTKSRKGRPSSGSQKSDKIAT